MMDFCNEAYYLFFSTLANRTRLAIIDLLKGGPKSIAEIAKVLEQSQDVVSGNLKQLEKCVFVTSAGSGSAQLYSLNMEIIQPISHALEFHTAKHCPDLRRCIPEEKFREYMKKEAAKETFIEHE